MHIAVRGLLIFALFQMSLGLFSVSNQLSKWQSSNAWVVHTYQVQNSLDALLSDLKDLETGSRGYLLTGKDSYLRPYHDSINQINPGYEKLVYLTRDNPKQNRRLKDLRLVLDKKCAVAQALVKMKPIVRDRVVVSHTDQGMALMDDIRERVAMLKAEENRLLTIRTKELIVANHQSAIMILINGTLSISMVVASLLCLMLDMRSRKIKSY